jgi:hypothetical protein
MNERTDGQVDGRVERLKAWVGIDPGKTGAMALLDEDGGVWWADWAGEREMLNQLYDWSKMYDIRAVCLEKVWVVRGNRSSSSTTFMQHVGAWKCILNLFDILWFEATPQQWMKRRVPAKLDVKDKPSLKYIMEKYPKVNLTGPRGGLRDGRSDAVCIAEYCMEIRLAVEDSPKKSIYN